MVIELQIVAKLQH